MKSYRSYAAPMSHYDLKQLIDYDPKTGHFARRKLINGKYPGTKLLRVEASLQYGTTIGIRGRHHNTRRIAWYWMTGYWPKKHDCVINLDGDEKNNSWDNLACVSRSEAAHLTAKIDRGVSYHKPTNTWQARIRAFKTEYHLGYHKTQLDAVAAVQGARRILFG